MDIDKLILRGRLTQRDWCFSPLMDIDKLILAEWAEEYDGVLVL